MGENMSLLSQNEVDTLIRFVRDQQGSEINGNVLSQTSVDKLINLLENANKKDEKNIRLNSAAVATGTSSFIAATDDIDTDKYELTYKCNDNGQVCLYACNVNNDSTIAISPQTITEHPDVKVPKTWGLCIMPVAFDQIAKELGMNYSDETMESVKELFAKTMYGNSETPIPSVYMPE